MRKLSTYCSLVIIGILDKIYAVHTHLTRARLRGFSQLLCLSKGKDFFHCLTHLKHHFSPDLTPLSYFVSVIITNYATQFYYTVSYSSLSSPVRPHDLYTKIVKYTDSKYRQLSIYSEKNPDSHAPPHTQGNRKAVKNSPRSIFCRGVACDAHKSRRETS